MRGSDECAGGMGRPVSFANSMNTFKRFWARSDAMPLLLLSLVVIMLFEIPRRLQCSLQSLNLCQRLETGLLTILRSLSAICERSFPSDCND